MILYEQVAKMCQMYTTLTCLNIIVNTGADLDFWKGAGVQPDLSSC